MERKKVAAFSTVEQVEAVDYEVDRKGMSRAAHEHAPWRRAPVPRVLADQLRQERIPGDARTLGEALQLISFSETWR